jgi:hypothetical protein
VEKGECAIQYAESKGVTVVAAMGNESEDLAPSDCRRDEPRRHHAGDA